MLRTVLGLPLGAQVWGSLGFDPHNGIAGPGGRYAFSSMTICQMVSKVVVWIYIPTSCRKGFCFCASSPILDINRLIFFCQSSGSKMLWYYELNLHFSGYWWHQEHLLMFIIHSCFFSYDLEFWNMGIYYLFKYIYIYIHIYLYRDIDIDINIYLSIYKYIEIYLFKYISIYLLRRVCSILFLICKGFHHSPPKHTNTISEYCHNK